MRPLLIGLVLLVSGCGVAVEPFNPDASVIDSATTQCPRDYPETVFCSVVGLECSFTRRCGMHSERVRCHCGFEDGVERPRWLGMCRVEDPCGGG